MLGRMLLLQMVHIYILLPTQGIRYYKIIPGVILSMAS